MSMQGACILSGVLGVRSWAPIMVCATKKHKWIITDSISVNKHEPGNMLFHMHQFNYSPKQHNGVDIIIPILKILNIKIREVKWLPQDHTVSDRTQIQSQVYLITKSVLWMNLLTRYWVPEIKCNEDSQERGNWKSSWKRNPLSLGPGFWVMILIGRNIGKGGKRKEDGGNGMNEHRGKF